MQPCVHHLNHALLGVGLKLAPDVIKYRGWEVQGISEVKPQGGDISQLNQQVVQVDQFIWREKEKLTVMTGTPNNPTFGANLIYAPCNRYTV